MSIYKPGRPSLFAPASGQGKRPPAGPGEYRIRSANREIAYIGETNNLQRRMGEHVRSGKLTSSCTFEWKLADGRSTSSTRREHERLKIAQHNPALNKSRGGEGRPAKH